MGTVCKMNSQSKLLVFPVLSSHNKSWNQETESEITWLHTRHFPPSYTCDTEEIFNYAPSINQRCRHGMVFCGRDSRRGPRSTVQWIATFTDCRRSNRDGDFNDSLPRIPCIWKIQHRQDPGICSSRRQHSIIYEYKDEHNLDQVSTRQELIRKTECQPWQVTSNQMDDPALNCK